MATRSASHTKKSESERRSWTHPCQALRHLNLILELRSLTRIVHRPVAATHRFAERWEEDLRRLFQVGQVVRVEVREFGVITATRTSSGGS